VSCGFTPMAYSVLMATRFLGNDLRYVLSFS
jgi:hypothetical protein